MGLVADDQSCGTLEQIAGRLQRIEQQNALTLVRLADLAKGPGTKIRGSLGERYVDDNEIANDGVIAG